MSHDYRADLSKIPVLLEAMLENDVAIMPDLYRELTEFVKSGLSNFNALEIATANGGKFIRKYIDADSRTGLVQPGYKANLVLLAENPLEDVRNARTVEAVNVNGHWTDAEQRTQLLVI